MATFTLPLKSRVKNGKYFKCTSGEAKNIRAFKVYRYIVEKPKELDGNFRLTLYTDKGIIIERRDNLNELLR